MRVKVLRAFWTMIDGERVDFAAGAELEVAKKVIEGHNMIGNGLIEAVAKENPEAET